MSIQTIYNPISSDLKTQSLKNGVGSTGGLVGHFVVSGMEAKTETESPLPPTQSVKQVSQPLANETIAAVRDASQMSTMDTRAKSDEPVPLTAGEQAKEKFLSYMKMNPAELYFTLKLEAKLSDMGMTMEEFAQLPPEEKTKIINELKDEIKAEAQKRAEQKAQEVRLAESAQQAAEDLARKDAMEDPDEKKPTELQKLAERLTDTHEKMKQEREKEERLNMLTSLIGATAVTETDQ